MHFMIITKEGNPPMSLITQGSEPASSDLRTPAGFIHNSMTASLWPRRLFFLVFLILFYIVELLLVGPVDGINSDWGMYSTGLTVHYIL